MGQKNRQKQNGSAAVAEQLPLKSSTQHTSAAKARVPRSMPPVVKWLGSLQIAVVLLSASGLILALGTMLESWYSAKLAQELIYRAWWFAGLLGLLAVNIFFAAAKKWPWKRYQLGFLITHTGLLLLLAGGVLNAVWGTDAEMAMVDTDDRATLDELAPRLGNLRNRSSGITFRGDSILSVTKLPSREKVSYSYDPGSLPWGDTGYDQTTPLWMYSLDTLARPWPRSFRQQVAKDANLEVTAFYPHCEEEDFSLAPRGHGGMPALQYRLFTPFFGWMPSRWLALNPTDTAQAIQPQGGGVVEFIGHCPEAMLNEFLKPPADTERGNQGQLVVRKGDDLLRLNVAEKVNQRMPLGKTGWQIEITRFVPGFRLKKDAKTSADPAVELALTRPDGKTLNYICPARFNADTGPLPDADGKAKPADADAPLLWYHPPDWKFGNGDLKGSLHFVATDTDKLYYRSFSSKTGPMRLEYSGPIESGGEEYPIWEAMKFKLQVRKFLPQALEQLHYAPVSVRPGLERHESFDPLFRVIRCELTATKPSRSGPAKTFRKEFQLREDSSQLVELQGEVDGVPFRDSYRIGFAMRHEELPFELKLVRAEQQVDPGSNSPATYTSFVQLTDAADGIRNQNHVITMNEPLDHHGYKFYQSTYRLLPYDVNGKPVSLSGFTVGRDPGLGLKYLGSFMLALGIFTMFYMKAYTVETMRRAFADRLGLDRKDATVSRLGEPA